MTLPITHGICFFPCTELISVFSGKFVLLDEMLPEMRDNGDRVLIFSQVILIRIFLCSLLVFTIFFVGILALL